MNGRFDFAAVSLTTKPTKGRRRKTANWLHVNIGEWEAKRLRALADCMGLEFRCFLETAVRTHASEHEEELEREMGMKLADVLKMSRARRREIGRKRQEIRRGCLNYGVCCADKN
jgi:hypothetical protein